MKLVLFRHAHKGFIPFEDPELSIQGFEQSARLVEMVKQNRLPTPSQLWVSPKRRTAQTFYPLSKQFGLKIEAKPDLDQHTDSENSGSFRKRIQNFINLIDKISEEREQNIFLCTHYDWIEEAMTLINSDKDLNSFEFSHWSPTQFVVFDLQKGLWKFIEKGSAK